MPPTVTLELMPRQLEAKAFGDDWTGVTSTAERRKRQNRLHQRAYRKRRRTRPTGVPISDHYSSYIACTASDAADSNRRIRTVGDGVGDDRRLSAGHPPPPPPPPPEGCLLLPTPKSRTEIDNFAQRAHQDYSHGTLRLEHLHTLIRLNVLNAISHNAALLRFRFQGLCRPELVSPFYLDARHLPNTAPTAAHTCPEWLRPTVLQVAVRHHPWIDLIPFPRMRDNILRALAAGLLDNKELGFDILDVAVANDRRNTASLIVWGEAWDPRGWEASVPFLQKWGWLLEGCPVILEATNYWRQKRGEGKLIL
ncbi:hypothetical protein BGZ61DRAFT_519676 [Ilyonectria robusta]|uniref:uncharacterized protein n=1 Tax=Ilyonectria robusta TaxID=1079257 RepID=UPI001E8CF089|nr:uncharacterized protein BGZ61DRAFT_519676 [Ilyonectria robusta]KAH8684065.1 hypothetical protein BGZ61DRAFT_519676 [Ilyonectria robusta]